MERVGILINKLNEQLAQEANVENMLVTVQMLQTELQQSSRANRSTSTISVVAPNIVSLSAKPAVRKSDYQTEPQFIKAEHPANNINQPENKFEHPANKIDQQENKIDQQENIIDGQANNIEQHQYKPVTKPELEPEPIPEPMPEPENPIADPAPNPTPKPEPEPIPHFLEGRPWEEIFTLANDTKRWQTEAVMEIPTLAHQDKIIYELNDSMATEEHSLNDKLNEQKAEMASMLQDTPIKDLKKAISINDRHRFIYELFRGDETMYERSIKTINSFNIFAEAEYWIQRELKIKLGWNVTLDLVKTFDQLVKRRFS